MEWIDSISYETLIPITLIIVLAPFFPKPHIVEKIQMLKNGTLKKPLDIFDLCYHLSPVIILFLKIIRSIT